MEEPENPRRSRPAGVAGQPNSGDTDCARAVARSIQDLSTRRSLPAQHLPGRRDRGQHVSKDRVRRLCTVDALLGYVIDSEAEGLLIDNEGPIDVGHRPPRHVS